MRRVLARQYLAELDARDPGRAALVDREEFLREYAEGNDTLEKAWTVCRARKNQREALVRKRLRKRH